MTFGSKVDEIVNIFLYLMASNLQILSSFTRTICFGASSQPFIFLTIVVGSRGHFVKHEPTLLGQNLSVVIWGADTHGFSHNKLSTQMLMTRELLISW